VRAAPARTVGQEHREKRYVSRVILVRHGQTALQAAGRYSGQRDTPLTPLGERQHELLRARLLREAIGRVVGSDLARCRVLAEAVAADHGLEAEPEPALREAAFGSWEGLTYGEAMAQDRQAMVAFNRDTVHVAPPGGESLAALAARAIPLLDACVRAHKQREGALLLVGHGGTLQALLCHLLAVPLARHWTMRVDNAALSSLDIYPMGAIIAVLNDTCHLDGASSM
jgi:broad specificity phosphatase PhoE